MSHVRFQLKQVNGKSQIYFGDDVAPVRKASEGQNKEKKKFSYKTRDQRFPLRGKPENVESPSKEPARPSGTTTRAGPGAVRKPRPSVGPGPKKASSGDAVTLTQEQLQLILNSVGKTAASDRDSTVRISVERTEGGLNIEASKTSPRRRGGRRQFDDEDSALGDSDAEEERLPVGRRARPEPSRGGGGGGGGGGAENILGLLGGGSKEGVRNPPRRTAAAGGPGKTKAKPVPPPSKGGKTGGAESGVNPDMDDKMRRIIAQNKGKMKESELVDLLAAVYMEERKKQLGLNEEKLESEGNLRKRPGGKGMRDDADDDYDKVTAQRGSRRVARNYGDGETEEDEEPLRRRRGIRRRDYDEEDDEEDLKPHRYGSKRREGSRRRRYDDEDERSDEEESDDERRRGRRGTKGRKGPQRRREDEEDEEEDRRRNRRRRSPEEDREEEEEAEEAKRKEGAKVEAPKFLTAVEKKRLQWEREREENAKIKEYDPWNKPGAGAPPKDYFSNAAAAMSKKEEEQQRYARELDAQLREKEQIQAAERRGGAAARVGRGAREEPEEGGLGGLGSSGLNNSGTFARGRGFASLDEKTSQDQEDKRKRQVEHQEAIKKQVEEQQAKRAQERQRRIDEELREEARLQRERETLQRQYDDEQAKARRREAEQETRLAQLQAANEAAEQAARLDKAKRRLQHLETSGHDTSGLRASLEAQLTSRSQPGGHYAPPLGAPALGAAGGYPPAQPSHLVLRHAAVPGLEGIAEASDVGGPGRWATPREVRVTAPKFDLGSSREDFQVQTDASLLQPIIQQAVEMAITSTAQARDLPMRGHERTDRGYDRTDRGHERTDRGHDMTYRGYERTERGQAPAGRPPVSRKVAETGPKYEHGFVSTRKPPGRGRHPVPVNERPQWGAANPKGRRTLPQSEREVAPSKRVDRQERRARRQAELMAEVEANLRRLPKGPSRRPGGHHPESAQGPRNWPGPEDDVRPHLGTYNLEEGNQPHTGRLTPPLPSRRRLGGGVGGAAAISRSEENLTTVGRALPSDGELGIVRTSEILNPAAAERPLQVSRENTERQLARRTYLKGLNPAHFGEHMTNLDDHRMEQDLVPKNNAKNPIFNPGIVKDMPTPRQDAILQHLSDIRKNLLLKQREIETSLSLGGNV